MDGDRPVDLTIILDRCSPYCFKRPACPIERSAQRWELAATPSGSRFDGRRPNGGERAATERTRDETHHSSPPWALRGRCRLRYRLGDAHRATLRFTKKEQRR